MLFGRGKIKMTGYDIRGGGAKPNISSEGSRWLAMVAFLYEQGELQKGSDG